MAEIGELWEIAEAALAEARAMPWGPERIEALRKAGLLRHRAADAQAAIDRRRRPNPSVRNDRGFLQDPD